jgi:hypothetical protein
MQGILVPPICLAPKPGKMYVPVDQGLMARDRDLIAPGRPKHQKPKKHEVSNMWIDMRALGAVVGTGK